MTRTVVARAATERPHSSYNVTVIRKQNKEEPTSSVSRQDVDTQFQNMGGIIEPPYRLVHLSRMIEQSNILPQTIESMYTNVSGYGYRIIPMKEGAEIDKEEQALLESLVSNANAKESLKTINQLRIKDYESYGFSFFEVIRDARGVPTILKHAKAYYTRICADEKNLEPQPVTVFVMRGSRRSKVVEYVYFKKFVQINDRTNKKTYFKEFGDPRVLNYETGEYATDKNPVPPAKVATELLYHTRPADGLYGVPRWISQTPNIKGSRESEEVNYDYFQDNTVPPIMISVTNGRLTQESFQTIQNTLNGSRGRAAQNRVVLIEAVTETIGLEDKSNATIKVDKLADARQSDGLFKAYDDSNINKILSSFRIDPMLVGMGASKTFASANVAVYVTESQVFQPSRMTHDEFLNMSFINHPSGLGLRTCKLESKSPSVTNPEQIVRILTAGNVMGAVTPRTAIDTINETMQLSLEQFPEKDTEGWELWMDQPMALSVREATQPTNANTQQTGQGDTTQTDQSQKTDAVKDTESSGDTGVDTTNNKQDIGHSPN